MLTQDNEKNDRDTLFKPFSEKEKSLACIGEVNSSRKKSLAHSCYHTTQRSVDNYFRSNCRDCIVFKIGIWPERRKSEACQ